MRGDRIKTNDLHGFDPADSWKINVHENHIRQVTSCKPDAIISILGRKQTHVRATGNKLLNELQVGRVILDI